MPRHEKKNRGSAGHIQHEKAEGKVMPINHGRGPRFGAFRGPR